MNEHVDPYNTLRDANVARNLEWTGDTQALPAFRAAELAGEVGEVLEYFFPDDSSGNVDSSDALLAEFADVGICLDLASMDLGLPTLRYLSDAELDAKVSSLDDARYHRPRIVETVGRMAAHAGKLCNQLKKREREARGWRGSRAKRSEMELHAREAWEYLQVAHRFYANGKLFAQTIADKFNKTSETLGLSTRYIAPA